MSPDQYSLEDDVLRGFFIAKGQTVPLVSTRDLVFILQECIRKFPNDLKLPQWLDWIELKRGGNPYRMGKPRLCIIGLLFSPATCI